MPKSHPCEICCESFPNRTSLRRHRFNRHTIPPPFEKDGKVHQVVHKHGRLECPFDICSKNYINRDDFQTHLRKVHAAEIKVSEDTPGPGTDETFRGGADALGPPVLFSSVREGVEAAERIEAIRGQGVGGVLRVARDVVRSEGLGEASTAFRAVHRVAQTDQMIPGASDKAQEAGASHGSCAEKAGRSALSGVELVPQVDYLIGAGILDRLGLLVHRQLLVLICRGCEVALTSTTAAGHLSATHGRKMKEKEKVELREICSQHKIYARPEEVPIPKGGGPPVHGIAPPTSGLTCSATADCHYSVRDVQTMLKHGREKHGRGLTTNALYRPSSIQVLFRGVGHTYFEVDDTLTPLSNVDLRAYLKRDFLPMSSIDEVITQQSDRDRPPLLKITLWDLFLPQIREDAGQRKQARGIKEKHAAHEHEGVFVSLEKAVNLHHEVAKVQLDHHCQRFTLAKVLVNGAKFGPNQTTYFRMLPRENYTYGALFVQMVRAMIRKEKGHELCLDFNFTEAQRSSLEILVDSLETNAKEDTKSTLLGAVTAYQAFCWSLVHTPELGSQANWGNPIQRFIWLMALRDDGSFIQASDLTPLLAKLKYFCRLTVLYEGVCCSEKEGALGRIGRLHDEVLSLGTPTAFNMIWELQQFASSLAYGQLKDPDVFVDPGYAWISIHGKTLHLERLRGGMQDLLKEAKDSFVALSSDDAWPAPRGDPIVDNLSNTQRGYCFLEEDPFRQRKHNFFLSAVERHKLGTLTSEGAWIWDELAILKFLDHADAVWDHLIHALYVGLQLSTRVTQLLQFQIRNADRPRNFVFQGKECMMISRYSKTTNAKGKDGCIPAFFSVILAEVFLVLLGSGFREAQALLAGVVYGSEARWCYRTYLCVKRGERIKPGQFYDWLQKRNQRQFGCGWGASEFRQGMVTLGHEFISANETFPCVDELLGESADHSTEVDASHYAVVHGALPRLSNNVLSQHRWLSEEWSSLLGLGPHPPPEPVRVIRTRARATNSLDSNGLALKVADLVSDALMSQLGAMGVTPDLIANLAQHQPMRAVSSPVGPILPHFTNRDAPPLDSPSLATTIQASSSGISADLADACSSVHAFEATPAPQTPKSSSVRLPDPHKRRMAAISSTQGSTRPKKRIRLPTSRSDTSSGGRTLGSSTRRACGDSASFKGFIVPDDSGGETSSQSSVEFDEDAVEDLLTDNSPPIIADGLENVPLPSNGDPPSDDALVTRNVSQVPFTEAATLRENIRWAMKVLLGNPAAREKSEAQMVGILTVMRGRQDAMITMRTGGGKSMLWQVPALLNDKLRFIVICPFTVLLEEQCERAERANIKAVNYGRSRAIPPDVQILFVQVEHVSSQTFTKLLLGPETPKFTHIFVDEHHDQLDCPKDRQKAWKMLAERASFMDMPIILLSGSVPPCLERPLMQTYGLSQTETAFVRSSTTRPEIGLHTVYLDPSASRSALARLVYALQSRVKVDERMLVWFASCEEAEEFATKAHCAVFHSSLPSTGNTKAYNLDLWDRGETRLMACTSALATGVDRPNVRFIVVYKPTYSLLMAIQMAGRAGRDGSESHVFFATSQRAGPKLKQEKDYSLVYELGKLVHEKECKVLQMTRYLDGEGMARACCDWRGQVPCDICEPNSETHQFAVNAVANPRQTVPNWLGDAGDGDQLPPGHRKLVTQAYAANMPAEEAAGKARAVQANCERAPQYSGDCSVLDPFTGSVGRAAEFRKVPANTNGESRGFQSLSSQAAPVPARKTLPLSHEIQRSCSYPEMSSHSSRVQRMRTAQEGRLASTKELDRYMPALKGKCPYHFVLERKLIDDDFPRCPREPKKTGDYRDFKRSFTFERFAYCYSCGLPQDRNRNGEGPICHMDHDFRKPGSCPFGQFVFRATFCLWQVPTLRAGLVGDLGIQCSLETQEEFTEWAVGELADQGHYHNCLEAFLWFCRRREQEDPQFFM